MSEVKRYRPLLEAELIERRDGCYVFYSDYVALEQRLKEAEQERDRMRDVLRLNDTSKATRILDLEQRLQTAERKLEDAEKGIALRDEVELTNLKTITHLERQLRTWNPITQEPESLGDYLCLMGRSDMPNLTSYSVVTWLGHEGIDGVDGWSISDSDKYHGLTVTGWRDIYPRIHSQRSHPNER